MERDFKGIWIDKSIWLNNELTVMEKLFLVEIDSLDNERGCFASNAHFSEFFQISKGRCTQIIKSLEAKKMVSVTVEREGKVITKRVIRILNTIVNKLNTPSEKIKYPYLENDEGNNTNINNTKRERRAHEFLKEEFPSSFESIEMQNRKQVSKWADLLEGFSDKVIIEKLPWESDVLFARLGTYIRQWRSNEAGKETAQEVKAPYLRKIS